MAQLLYRIFRLITIPPWEGPQSLPIFLDTGAPWLQLSA